MPRRDAGMQTQIGFYPFCHVDAHENFDLSFFLEGTAEDVWKREDLTGLTQAGRPPGAHIKLTKDREPIFILSATVPHHVKTVEIFEDDEATTAAQGAVSKVYVGYIASRGDWDDDEDEENTSYRIHLLRSGLPKSSPEEFIEVDMCTPVFPNTDHRSRKPLTPSEPLPIGWTHCYHASFETVTLRVPWAFAKPSFRVTLPQMTRAKHNTAVIEDKVRRAKRARAPQKVNWTPMAELEESAPSSAPSNEQNSVSTPPQSVSSRGRTVSVASLNEEDALKPVPPPIAAVSYDIAAVPTLVDPQGLLAEIKVIETQTLTQLLHALSNGLSSEAAIPSTASIDSSPATAKTPNLTRSSTTHISAHREVTNDKQKD
ncbi:hypothetical protein FIBSPDRAFT_944250 [Athelia psychrophila]|uniref:Uncharacterized protein n=1 Tax=Athelia psychrophila TaxID=1759441 RepID=A0A166UZ18_9AGAM|nr:hypothetical protein FIBSPDRAFT_944250 [Fibularhizoctonia sp. CBS 109695]